MFAKMHVLRMLSALPRLETTTLSMDVSEHPSIQTKSGGIEEENANEHKRRGEGLQGGRLNTGPQLPQQVLKGPSMCIVSLSGCLPPSSAGTDSTRGGEQYIL